jgi:hypothetical protein
MKSNGYYAVIPEKSISNDRALHGSHVMRSRHGGHSLADDMILSDSQRSLV